MICDLTPEDANYLAFYMREIDKREIMATRWNDYEGEFGAECAAIGGVCYKTPDGIPVAMGGVFEVWPGVGTAWMVATPDIKNHGVGLTKLARHLMVTHKHLHRIQAYSADFHHVSHEWLELVGFKRGPTLKHYGRAGEDFILFELVRD